MNILSFGPEPAVYVHLKKPFDTDFHQTLVVAANKTLAHIVGYAEAVVTNLEATIVSACVLEPTLISYFTAHANKIWSRNNLLLFNVNTADHVGKMDQGISNLISEVRARYKHNAELDYEMYIEEHRSNLHGGLFPDYTFLPFNQTPEFYQQGIILTK